MVYPVTDESGLVYYPCRPNYATTIYKVQGQNLKHATIWFDTKNIGPGAAYVAVSRVSYMKDLIFLETPLTTHFRAIHANTYEHET